MEKQLRLKTNQTRNYVVTKHIRKNLTKMTLGQKRDWKKPIKGKEKAPFKQSRMSPQKGGRENETTRFIQKRAPSLGIDEPTLYKRESRYNQV